MKRLFAVIVMVLLLAGVVFAQELPGPYVPPDGQIAGYAGIDLWALYVDPYGPTPVAHNYLAGKFYRAQMEQIFQVVERSAWTDIIAYDGTWVVVYYLADSSVATLIMLPR